MDQLIGTPQQLTASQPSAADVLVRFDVLGSSDHQRRNPYGSSEHSVRTKSAFLMSTTDHHGAMMCLHRNPS
eukprot:scaffold37983_cov150-Skeletonema_dohrnii-CCMP3373.AAC.2